MPRTGDRIARVSPRIWRYAQGIPYRESGAPSLESSAALPIHAYRDRTSTGIRGSSAPVANRRRIDGRAAQLLAHSISSRCRDRSNGFKLIPFAIGILGRIESGGLHDRYPVRYHAPSISDGCRRTRRRCGMGTKQFKTFYGGLARTTRTL